MEKVVSVSTMQSMAGKWKSAGKTIALVPTMGYLHQGHVSLVQRARKLAGSEGKVVTSIYVNPTQFAPTEDLDKYPRDLKGDMEKCRNAGCDVVFVPENRQMYPSEVGLPFSTFVNEESLSKTMEGQCRPIHFRGVTTVVAKLFNIVLPDVAIFGAKDWQQAAIIKKMVSDLNFPIKIIVAPIVREKDGLAMSSRNKYLNPDQRQQALALSKAIQTAKKEVAHSRKALPVAQLKQKLIDQIQQSPEARVDYIEFFNSKTLEQAVEVKRGTHIAMAVFVGTTRLIDNSVL